MISTHKLQMIFLGFLALMLLFSAAKAQNAPPPDPQKQQFGNPQSDPKPNLLSELGLSPEQMLQIRRMNAERKPLMAEATRRLREANHNLDLVIYGDSVNDEEFQSRLKEFQEAQAEMSRLRFMNELTVRRILTPEQLVKFREVRRRFAEERKEIRQQRRAPNEGQPPQQFNRNRPLHPVQ